MWDKASSKTFTFVEAKKMIGKTVKTSAETVITVSSVFCEGRNQYTVSDGRYNYYKSHNSCAYIVN